MSFDITAIFQSYFGVKPLDFNFDQVPAVNQSSSKGLPLYEVDDWGRTYFMPIYMGADNSSLNPLPYPTITGGSRMGIIETSLTERNGSVEEIINMNNFEFRIRGLIIDKNGNWPEAQMQALLDLQKQQQTNGPVIMQSAFSDMFLLTKDRGGNDKVIIKSIYFPEGRGDIKVRAYEMEVMSVEDFSLLQI